MQYELIQQLNDEPSVWTPAHAHGYNLMQAAARDWDGRDPVRSRSSLH